VPVVIAFVVDDEDFLILLIYDNLGVLLQINLFRLIVVVKHKPETVYLTE
jgi:hypothetical protein